MNTVIIKKEKTQLNTSEERNYAIDLLRIIAMLMIICLHILGQGREHSVLHNTPVMSVNYIAEMFLETAAYGAVNIYALISGYVYINSRFKPNKIIFLWLEVIFYDIIMTALGLLLKPELTGIDYFTTALKQWYIVSYSGMFFFIPFLNRMIHSLSRND